MAHNPELLSAQQALSKAHAGLKAARAEYIPDISIVAQHAISKWRAAVASKALVP